MPRRLPGPMRRLGALLLSLLAVTALAGCNLSDLQGTNGKQYIGGEGTVVQIKPADRGNALTVTGTDLDGKPLDLASYRGRTVMLTSWADWCGPCVAEMPKVVALDQSVTSGSDADKVAVLGINVRQNGGASAGRSFEADNKMTFPSFEDPSSKVLLSLSDKFGPYTLPSTVVLDSQGRLAAVVLGPIPGVVGMREILEQVADGG